MAPFLGFEVEPLFVRHQPITATLLSACRSRSPASAVSALALFFVALARLLAAGTAGRLASIDAVCPARVHCEVQQEGTRHFVSRTLKTAAES
jgi:hypothetical protein